LEQSCVAAVEMRGLRKVFGEGATRVEALAGVDLDIAPGHFVAVMGPSGSGKSTLLHLVAGLDKPDSGELRVAGQDILKMTDDELTLMRRRKMGMVFQSFNLLDVLTAEENVSLPLVVDGISEAEATRMAAAALERVGLARRGQHRPRQMSGGEQQRVAIARALAIKPVLLLADEPTGNLDSHNGDQVMHLLRELVDQGQTILMVTHNPAHAEMADRIVTFRDGSIVDDQWPQRAGSSAEESRGALP
jgi:putative ABC transport system ATP-binding protein